MPQHQDLNESQWEIVSRFIPEPKRRHDGRGRPWKGPREVLNGILYILHTGVAWAELPHYYPPYQTCHRRFQQWVRSGVMSVVLDALAEDLPLNGALKRRAARGQNAPQLTPWAPAPGDSTASEANSPGPRLIPCLGHLNEGSASNGAGADPDPS